jgi:hypothetical protein
MFPLFATGIVDTGGKLATCTTILAKLVENFAAGVVDTGGAPFRLNDFYTKSKSHVCSRQHDIYTMQFSDWKRKKTQECVRCIRQSSKTPVYCRYCTVLHNAWDFCRFFCKAGRRSAGQLFPR